MRLRITFAKTEAMRFTGHLDLHQTWERCFRRAGLPLAYSQGFSPHPRLNLASALPLGFTSQAELIDAWMQEELPLENIAAALKPALPPGIQLLEIRQVDPRLPSLQSAMQASEFAITFLDPVEDLAEKVQSLLESSDLPRQRRNKSYDLRPLILDLQPLPKDERGRQRLFARLSAREGQTGRPEEVVDALGEAPEATRVHRTGLLYEE